MQVKMGLTCLLQDQMQSTVPTCECVHSDAKNGTDFVKPDSRKLCTQDSVFLPPSVYFHGKALTSEWV